MIADSFNPAGQNNPGVHDIKCDTGPFWLMYRGKKPFDIRQNDRNYQIGDILIIREHDRETGNYIGPYIVALVLSTLVGYGIEDGYIAMGLDVLRKA